MAGKLTRAEELHYTEPTWTDEGDDMATMTNGVGETLFEVVCTIGSVRKGGDLNPVQAAFLLIADHDAPGLFRFPREGGGEYVVSVDRTEAY